MLKKEQITRFLLPSIFVVWTWNQANAAPSNISAYFAGEDACFLLYDVGKGQAVTKYNEKRCSERVPPCSTFKVALALMAFDKGILKDENAVIKWDGKTYEMPGWNKDQTAVSWMKESTIWVSQRITKELGKKTVEKYLRDFGYGTADMSGGIETAWLTATSLAYPVKPTVLISAEEQAQFLTKLWKGELPVSKHAIEMVKKATFIEKSPQGFELSGKTGSGFVGGDRSVRVGWFVGHLAKGNEQYVSVIALTDSVKSEGKGYAGPEARETTKKILKELGKY